MPSVPNPVRCNQVALLSQTALNQLMKTLSIELARKKMNISCILLHPGTCDTDMSEPFRRNVVSRLGISAVPSL